MNGQILETGPNAVAQCEDELSALFERGSAPVAQWIEQLTTIPADALWHRTWAGYRRASSYLLSFLWHGSSGHELDRVMAPAAEAVAPLIASCHMLRPAVPGPANRQPGYGRRCVDSSIRHTDIVTVWTRDRDYRKFSGSGVHDSFRRPVRLVSTS